MIYIQSNTERTMPHHFDAASAYWGAESLNMPIRLTSFEEVASGTFNSLIKQNLFVGSVEFMKEVFSKADSIPNRIMNSDREVSFMTIYQVRKTVESGKNVFIKPLEQKLFTGFLVDKWSLNSLNNYDDNLDVMVYEPLPNILSEWRVYMHHKSIEDSRNYSGDFKISPDYNYVNTKIEQLSKKLPSAYTMDIGICENGENVIIEFNDMYAIGNYGMENDRYVMLLRERYFEIMRNSK